jgi:glycerate dehydrogenase
MAVGRRAALNSLNFTEVGIETHARGVKVNDFMQTNIPHIYAIGDINGLMMLAHAATFQGIVALDHIMGIQNEIDLNVMPAAVFTSPEAASVGMTEDECKEKGIAVANVKGYSTNSVSQLTLAMALSLSTNLTTFRSSVNSGQYTNGGVANVLTPVFEELAGKTWGIVGYGNIGKKVGEIAKAIGCNILAYSKTPKENVENVTLEELCSRSDVISIHLPLSPQTKEIIGEKEISLMKSNVILINVARGAVCDENALANAIKENKIGGLGVDVYSIEPMPISHPFNEIKNYDNVCLTPHMAWGAKESRQRCVNEVAQNIKAFYNAEKRNRIV